MKAEGNDQRLINAVYQYLIYPLASSRVHGGLGRRLRQYERQEVLSLQENRLRQWQALLRLLKHAYDTTIFYRNRFDYAGLTPSQITSPADMQKIPPLTREHIREHLTELQSNAFRSEDLIRAATGGTTDTPVPLLRNRAGVRDKTAVQWRFNNWAGFYPGDKVFHLWGARQDYSENPSWRWRLYDRHLMRQVWAPTSLLNESVLERYRQSLNRFQPRVVYAYPTPLTLFCEYLRDSGKPYHRPTCTICTAEPLLAHQRKTIEEVFGLRVFEHYGSREFAMIAGECETHQGMHLNPAAAYLEYIPLNGSDTDGLNEILVTDLLNYGMPLIRYRINDCVVLGSEACACGRGYPQLKRVIGRTADVFYLPNGDAVPGVTLTNRVLKACPGLKKVQVIQETLQNFRVRYVRSRSFQPSDLTLLRHDLARFVGNDIHWIFEEVSDIERERSGKTRFCISRVGPQSAHPLISSNRA